MKYSKLLLLTIIYSVAAKADFEGLYFRGYGCTQDCSGHIAGYNWAIKNQISGPENCSGNSASFVEGCISVFIEGAPDNITLIESKKSKNFAIGCVGSKGYGGSCYDGYGGPLYDGYGGPLYDGYGGSLYDGYGGPCYVGYGGNCYEGYGGDMNKCPILCR